MTFSDSEELDAAANGAAAASIRQIALKRLLDDGVTELAGGTRDNDHKGIALSMMRSEDRMNVWVRLELRFSTRPTSQAQTRFASNDARSGARGVAAEVRGRWLGSPRAPSTRT